MRRPSQFGECDGNGNRYASWDISEISTYLAHFFPGALWVLGTALYREPDLYTQISDSATK